MAGVISQQGVRSDEHTAAPHRRTAVQSPSPTAFYQNPLRSEFTLNDILNPRPSILTVDTSPPLPAPALAATTTTTTTTPATTTAAATGTTTTYKLPYYYHRDGDYYCLHDDDYCLYLLILLLLPLLLLLLLLLLLHCMTIVLYH